MGSRHLALQRTQEQRPSRDSDVKKQEENSSGSADVPKKVSQYDIAPVKPKKRSAVLPSSVSSHDLRCSDMEKEREDVSSPRGVIEACLRGSESERIDNNTKQLEAHSNSRARGNWSKFFKLWKRKSVKRLASFPPLVVPRISMRKSQSVREDTKHIYKGPLKEFSFYEIRTATNNFSSDNLIGKGGFAEVYKGRLRNGTMVAVKKLIKGTENDRLIGYLNEVGVIAYVDHPNTAKLLGCDFGGMNLIFHLSPLGSLGSFLHGPKEKLDWRKRYKVALGTADGLKYLHENCTKRIIHRDIKADNILLTEDYKPQICDFGLAKWLPNQWTHYNVSKFEGTFGYFAPEYFMHGIVDEKVDVYAFGVLLLELITGREPVDQQQQSLVLWAKPLLDRNEIKELVDPFLADNYNPEEIERVALTASLCIEHSPILRPKMSQVAVLLKGDQYIQKHEKGSQERTLQRTYSEELFDAQEYNSTKYLSDLSRHKEVALGA